MYEKEQMAIIKFMKDEEHIDANNAVREAAIPILAIRHEYGFQKGNLIQNKIFESYKQANQELIESKVLLKNKPYCIKADIEDSYYLNKEYLDVI